MIAKKDILVSICISCSIFKLFIIFVWKWAFTLSLSFIYVYILEKEMATHSSTLAWKILWTEEPGGLQSMVLQRVGQDWVTNTFTSLSFTLVDWPKKTLVQFMSKNVLPMFPSRSFTVSCLTLKSVSHFEFILVYGVRVCSNFIDLPSAVQLFQYCFLKRMFFPFVCSCLLCRWLTIHRCIGILFLVSLNQNF